MGVERAREQAHLLAAQAADTSRIFAEKGEHLKACEFIVTRRK